MKRPITELKDTHKGEDVWIIGSGSSMDYIDPSFFDNKITIGVNDVYKKYEHCSYNFMIDNGGIDIPRTKIPLEEIIEYVETKSPSSKVVVSEYDCGVLLRAKNEHDTTTDYWYFETLDTQCTPVDYSVLGTDKLIVGASVITSALHFAAYLGAKNIILCGCDCGHIDGNSYFKELGPLKGSNLEEKEMTTWLEGINLQNIATRDAILDKFDVNIHSLNPFINLGLEGHKYH